ncbi:TPA: hypothetical protein M2O71_001423 [Klebsiella pneumoniae]|nr:hypothetical protein [Klebsiella pneumoniae]
MPGDYENEPGFFDGGSRLPDNVEPLHVLHRPYNPQKESETDDSEQE